MVTLALDGADVPEYGAAVTSAGEPAGTLTSPCESPTLEKVIGLAVLRRRFAERGARARCRSRRRDRLATVEPLPIYDPDKRRPRAESWSVGATTSSRRFRRDGFVVVEEGFIDDGAVERAPRALRAALRGPLRRPEFGRTR